MAIEMEANKTSREATSVMGLPHITSFCCCLGLEVGTKLIAVMHLITSLCMVVLCSVYAVQFGAHVGTVEDAGDQLYSAWHKLALCVAVVSVGHVLLAVALIYGVWKRKTGVVRCWVLLMLLLWLAGVAFNLVTTVLNGVRGEGSEIFLSFLEGTLFFGVIAYCILCVHSYYLMLKSCEDMHGPY